MIDRRRALFGLGTALFAPAVIRTPGLLMPTKPLRPRPTLAPAEFLKMGSGPPYRFLGSDGDYYIDRGSPDLEMYGPRANGEWPRATISLRGPLTLA